MKSFLVALQFLTRFHVTKQVIWTEENLGDSVPWFPAVGWVIGLFLCLIEYVMSPLELPLLTSFFLVAGEFIITGAMHADGLMDTADGLLSGRSRERSLEIMKDSLIGSFGLLAFVFLVLLKTFCLASIDTGKWGLLMAMPVIGRLNMVFSLCEYPYARPFGMGKAFSEYRPSYAEPMAIVLALVPAFLFGMMYLVLAGAGLLAGLYINRWVVSKIGGTTGDTYGFVTEITEVLLAFLFVIFSKGSLWFM